MGPPLICFKRSAQAVSCSVQSEGGKSGRTASSVAVAALTEMERAFARTPLDAGYGRCDGTWAAHWFTGSKAELEIVTVKVGVREASRIPFDGGDEASTEGTVGSGWTVWSGGTQLGPPNFFDPPPPIADPEVAAELHLALKPPGKKQRLTWRAWGSLQVSRVRKLDWGRQSREPWTPSHDAKILGNSTSVLPAGYSESSHQMDAERAFQPMFDGI